MLFTKNRYVQYSEEKPAEAIDESAEFIQLTKTSDRTVQQIPIDRIEPNSMNGRSLDGVDVIKESIRRTGKLFEPLLVYSKDGKYILLSGHRRYAAWKSLCEEPGSSWSRIVPCIVLPKPETEYDEKILMSQANIHRSDPEEIRNEVRIAIDIWNSMPEVKRQEMKTWLKTRFTDEQETEITEEYLRCNFRPKLEFVRFVTGIRSTNKTITKMIQESNGEKQVRQKPVMTKEKLLRQIQSLIGNIKKYEFSPERRTEMDRYIEVLEQLGEAIKNAW